VHLGRDVLGAAVGAGQGVEYSKLVSMCSTTTASSSAAGGKAVPLLASGADVNRDHQTARGIVGKTRRRLASNLIIEFEGIDKKIKAISKEPTNLVEARGSELMTLHGIGPSGAARLRADVGDIHQFADRDKLASWNGTAALDASSGDQTRHRLSRAGNRRINRALHIMATVQLRNPTEGRAYFDAKKAAGKTSMEAIRALKRRLLTSSRPDGGRPETTRGDGPGRALGDDSAIQRDRPNSGPATSQPKTALQHGLTQRGRPRRP
jgi:transposase